MGGGHPYHFLWRGGSPLSLFERKIFSKTAPKVPFTKFFVVFEKVAQKCNKNRFRRPVSEIFGKFSKIFSTFFSKKSSKKMTLLNHPENGLKFLFEGVEKNF